MATDDNRARCVPKPRDAASRLARPALGLGMPGDTIAGCSQSFSYTFTYATAFQG
ncbi:hypothetical protein [Frankia sp. CiP3]|uniref:hypothetical protein n=1 Tax=Frankia sp. CiP3 TaxID=2880971 RepID=UPI001EF51D7F|nr:hypothetical protein [Frankia sp. CiP3]